MSYSKIKDEVLIIKKFLIKDEVSNLKSIIYNQYKVDDELNIYAPYRYPDIDWENISALNKMSSIFNQTLDLENVFAERMTKNFEQNNFIPVSSLVSDGLKFNAYTLRVLQPNKVDIHHHVENQAIPHYPKFFSQLNDYIEIMNQYSFVLMIQQPEKGGEIIIYKDIWEGPEKIDEQRLNLEKLDNENKIEPKIKNKIKLSEGDLLIFPAGISWHKVAEVYGNLARITIGGFMGKLNTDKDTYGFWS